MNTVSKRTFNLVLAGVMIAMGTALGFVKPFELPYGCLLYTSGCH